jgi:hypothetical protein
MAVEELCELDLCGVVSLADRSEGSLHGYEWETAMILLHLDVHG